jgi:hypothetical protein
LADSHARRRWRRFAGLTTFAFEIAIRGKAAEGRRTSMKKAVPVKGDGFCERCGYTSIRAQGTKG